MMTSELRAAVFASASICALAVGAPAAFAQPAATPAASSTQLEEVVVTAERREASLQDVPISVTAIGAAKLESKQILDIMSLNRVVPGFAAKPTLSPLEISIAIRGVTQLIPSVAVDPSIGFYVDGVYNVNNAGSNLGLIDMERVEVLKGPQGTLFGRNTIGGAVSITTAKPTDEFSGYAKLNIGNFDAQTYLGVINGPIVPGVLSARLVYQHDEHDGYGKNFTLNRGANSLNQDYVRGTVKLTPSDGWEILGSAFYVKAHGDTAAKLGFIDPTSGLGIPGLPPLSKLIPLLSGNPSDSLANYVGKGGFWDSYGDVTGYSIKQSGVTGTVTGKLSDAVTVKSITAFSTLDYLTVSDLDATPYKVLDLISFPLNSDQFSQEFQVYGDAFDNKLKWIAGAYYFDVKGDQINNVVALGPLRFLPTLFGGPAGPATHNAQGPFIKNTSYSAFAQLTYEIMDNVRLTGGLRYVTDERKVAYRDHLSLGDTATGSTVPGAFISCNLPNAAGSPIEPACVFRDSVKYHYVPWTVGVDYKPNDDMLLYAKISKGFRSGAFPGSGPVGVVGNPAANAGALAAFGPAAPERLVSYEGGAKMQFLDNRLRVNAAGYWSKYDNIQLSINRAVPGCPTCTPIASLENSGSAEIWGGELEVTALLGGLTLDGQVGYTHPKYVSGANLGKPVINVSKLNYAIGASYPIETSAGTLTLNGGYSYRSKAFFFPVASGLPPAAAAALSQKGYGLFDAQVSFELANMPVTIAVYGQNLANKKYINSATNFPPPLSFVWQGPGIPRTYGASVKYVW